VSFFSRTGFHWLSPIGLLLDQLMFMWHCNKLPVSHKWFDIRGSWCLCKVSSITRRPSRWPRSDVDSQGSQDQMSTLKVTKVTLTLHKDLVPSHLGRLLWSKLSC
jgi:hypothetical protein